MREEFFVGSRRPASPSVNKKQLVLSLGTLKAARRRLGLQHRRMGYLNAGDTAVSNKKGIIRGTNPRQPRMQRDLHSPKSEKKNKKKRKKDAEVT